MLPARILLSLTPLLFLSACSIFGDHEASGPATAPYPADGSASKKPVLSDKNSASSRSNRSGIAENTLNFDFESSVVRDGDADILTTWAAYLKKDAKATVRLEGHTDEIGTSEYNIGLGEQRAIAVKEALVARGANAAQLSVLSYGEEKPVNSESNRNARRQNRRVELID